MKENQKTWAKIFFQCKHLTSEDKCLSSNCRKPGDEGDEWRCCVYCEERLTCRISCKYTPFKKYIKGEKGS